MHTKVFLLVSFLVITAAYPDGAPEASCFTMLPTHGFEPQTTVPPFLILISSLDVQGGETVTVTVQGRFPLDTFRGFMVQFRNIVYPYEPVGTVLLGEGVRPMNCNGGPTTATHINNLPTAIQPIQWIAPMMRGGVTVQ